MESIDMDDTLRMRRMIWISACLKALIRLMLMVIVPMICKSARYLFIKRVFSCSSLFIQFESEHSSIGNLQNRLFIGNVAALHRKYKYEINISGQMKSTCGIIRIFNGCVGWTEKTVPRVTVWQSEAYRVMPDLIPRDGFFLSRRHTNL